MRVLPLDVERISDDLGSAWHRHSVQRQTACCEELRVGLRKDAVLALAGVTEPHEGECLRSGGAIDDRKSGLVEAK
jgi:hypothetical protein